MGIENLHKRPRGGLPQGLFFVFFEVKWLWAGNTPNLPVMSYNTYFLLERETPAYSWCVPEAFWLVSARYPGLVSGAVLCCSVPHACALNTRHPLMRSCAKEAVVAFDVSRTLGLQRPGARWDRTSLPS